MDEKNYPQSQSGEIDFEVPAHGVVVLKITGTIQPFNVYQFKDNYRPSK